VAGGRALVALAVAVGGAVGAFAIYTFGWHDNGAPRRSHVITLREGDVVVRPQAATRCEASGEGGRPNLFCTRLHGGRHQVIFYSDAVLVWPLQRGPDGPPFSYLWTPYVLGASRDRQFLGMLELRSLRHAVTYADAIQAFGKATACRLLGYPSEATATWRSLGLRLRLVTLGAQPPGKNGCTAPGSIQIHSAYVTGERWQTLKGLRVGLPAEIIRKLYPHAVLQRRTIREWPAPAYWIVHVRERCVVGVCSSRYATSPRLTAVVRGNRVTGFYFPVGAEGE
jgi:hypothetical protein